MWNIGTLGTLAVAAWLSLSGCNKQQEKTDISYDTLCKITEVQDITDKTLFWYECTNKGSWIIEVSIKENYDSWNIALSDKVDFTVNWVLPLTGTLSPRDITLSALDLNWKMTNFNWADITENYDDSADIIKENYDDTSDTIKENYDDTSDTIKENYDDSADIVTENYDDSTDIITENYDDSTDIITENY